MINQTIKKNLITIIIISLLSASPTIMHGKQTKFELKKKAHLKPPWKQKKNHCLIY